MAQSPDPHARRANRLGGETSPYLLQHAHNPVDWHPWGREALDRAIELDRPVFLSIGYAACHWCHVMERESFEDEATAAQLNAHFIAIKVDREERPDLDALYMGAVQALTGQGGWPMSVFLTPEGRPFYGGTYFPPEPRHGLPSFRQVLDGVRRAWTEQRAELEEAGGRLVRALAEQQRAASPASGLPPAETLVEAAAQIADGFDPVTGGWGRAPKFPQAMTIEALLRRHVASGAALPLEIARRSLDAMAAGGIHDHLGGGFHRYSTDAHWLVPHFEQMLYDNAQLARVYIHAWALAGDPSYQEAATGVLDYLLREMRTTDGAFAASQDADTNGEEGATFVWSAAEIRDVLGADAALVAAAYGATDGGNWEGHTILSRTLDDAELGERFGLSAKDVGRRLAAGRERLLARRASRPQPARDDKVLAAWNGLAIAALAEAARGLSGTNEPGMDRLAARYREAAVVAAETVTRGLMGEDGRLRRSWKDGRATADGVLEDYANLADGLVSLYDATQDERWFSLGVSLVETILARFGDPEGGFFDTPDDGESLVVRPKGLQDNATPSGGAMTATVLLRLMALTGDQRYADAAERALATVAPYLARYPTGFAQWLCALELAHAGITEVAVVGDPAGEEARRLLRVVDRGYHPFRVLAASPAPESSVVPLLAHRFALHGRATAFVCREFACRQPVHEPEALEALLAGA